MEKYAKSVEVLKSYLTDKVDSEKKDEKILHLTLVCDFVCEFNDNRIQEFSQILASVIEIILTYCGDSNSDVRSNAAECLEKISKAKINYFFKILANIFKELKRCDNPRSLKTALTHIADLMPYLQPQKYYIIQASFGPEICRLAGNENEAILEALPVFIDKVYSIVGCGLNHKDVQVLTAPFLDNLSSKNAVSRRSASLAVYHVCRHSAFPVVNTLHAMKTILTRIIPLNTENIESDLLVGSLICLRHMLSVVETNKNTEELDNVSSLVPILVLCFEMFCHLCCHTSSVVKTAALEALLSIVKICPIGLKRILTRAGGIPRVQIFDNAEEVLSWSPNDSITRESSKQTSSRFGESLQNLEDNASSEVPLFNSKLANRSDRGSIGGRSGAATEKSSSGYIGSTSSSAEDLPERIRALSTKDNFDDELTEDRMSPFPSDSMTESFYASEGQATTDTLIDASNKIDIGIYSSHTQSPAMYALRLVCSEFLLTGEKSKLRADNEVRISIKCLALQIVAQVCALEDIKDLQLFLNINSLSIGEPQSQFIEDVLLFMSHSDPQVRSGCVNIYGSILKSFLEGQCLEAAGFSTSVEALLKALSDPEAPVVRAALTVLASSIQMLLQICADSALIVDVIETVLFHKSHKYWLVKLSAMEFFRNVDFNYLMFHEANCPAKASPVLTLQTQILEFIIEQIQSSSQNLREPASKILVSLVEKICTPSSNSLSFTHEALIIVSTELCNANCPNFKSIPEIYMVDKSMHFQKIYTRSSAQECTAINFSHKLAFVTNLLFRRLNECSDSSELYGVLLTLKKLAELYVPRNYPSAWQMCPLPQRNDLNTSEKFGNIRLCLNLLNSPICTNVITHACLIDLITTLLCSAAIGFLESPQVFDDTMKTYRDWPAIHDEMLASLFVAFFHHVLKCLNIVDHVLRNREPATSPVKSGYPKLPTNLTSLPSYFPNTPNLPSPIRKKGQKLVETAVTKARNTSATLPSFPTKLLEEAKKESISMFTSGSNTPPAPTPPKPLDTSFSYDTNLMLLFEILSSMNRSLKVSSLTSQNDKFIIFTSSVLKSIGNLFHYASTREISLYVDTILRQVELCLNLTPIEAIKCVQDLFHSVFGTSICHNPLRVTSNVGTPKKREREVPFLYTSTFTDPYMRFTQELAPDANANGDPSVSNLKREMKQKSGPVWQFQNRMQLVNQHIKSFESLVLNSLRKYSSSSRPCDRLIVIELLCQLINLKVNYNLLDNEHSFLKFLSDQLAIFSDLRGNLSEAHADLLGHAMVFFVQLSHQKFEGKPIVYLEKITQHCSALSKVDNKVSIHVLRPVVHDLFARRGISVSDPEEQVVTTSNLETSGSKAARQIISVLLLQLSDFPEAWDLIIVALRHSRHEGEIQHKMFSRQCSDNIVPLLENSEVTFQTVLDIDRLQQLIALFHPSVGLINSEHLLRLFFKPLPTDSFRNFRNSFSIFTALVNNMCRFFQDESLLTRIKELKTKIVSDSSSIYKCSKPEEMIANQFLHVIASLNACENFDFEVDKISQHIFKLFQHLQFLIKSSSPFAKKIAENFARLINGAQISHTLTTNIITLNDKVKRLLVPLYPYLFLQWCDILFSVGYTKDQSWWPSILNYSSDKCSSSPSQMFLTKSCFLLLVDSAVATASKDMEPMSWVIINHLNDVCSYAEEPPVVDFLSIVYQQPPLSSLLVQKFHDNEMVNSIINSTTKYKFLTVIKSLHPTISHKVLLVLCGSELLINNRDLVFQRGIINIVIAKLQHLTNSTTCDQPPLDELDLVARRLYPMNVHKKFPKLMEQLVIYFGKFANESSNFLKDTEKLQQSKIMMSEFAKFDSQFVRVLLTKNRDQISDEDHARFVDALPVEESKSYLSGFDANFGLVLCLFQNYTHEQAQNNADRIGFIDFVSEMFLSKTNALLNRFAASQDLVGLRNDVNPLMSCIEYYIVLNASWLENLAPHGSNLLHLSERMLETVTESKHSECKDWLDIQKLLKFIPYVAVLTQIVTREPFEKSVKLCKLLMLLTRNFIPTCFPTLKIAQKDDKLVTIRESAECVLLLSKENPSNEIAICLKNALASLCRHPSVVEICRVPEDMWAKGFSVETIKEKPLNIDTSFLLDPDLFYDFQNRVETFGWVSRQSFEEIWMIYLSVLNASNEEEIDLLEEKWKIRKMSFNAIINLVAVAMRTLLPGNPTLIAPSVPLNPSRPSKFRSGRRNAPEIHYPHIAKLKRQLTSQFREVVRSSSVHFAELLSQSVFAHLPENVVDQVKVDLNSCVVLLNEQCHHWLTDATIPTSVTCDVFKGLILLSNLFVDTNQFDWLYVLISNLHRTLPAEDELTALYTIPLLCQSINATTDIERHSEEIDHLISIFVAGLSSSMLSIETTTLCGLSLLMKCADKNRSILRPIMANHIQMYVLNRITAATSVAASRPSQHYMLSLVALTFDTITNFISELRDTDFVSTAVQMFLVYSSICTKNVFCAIFSRIDELVISQALNRKVADFVIKTCFEHIKNASTKTILRFSVSLLLSCVYSYYPPAVHNLESDENISIDSIERVTRIIEKFEFSSAQHASILVRPLGRLMIDYLNLHERFYKATSLLQKHRTNVAQSCCVYLVFDIFQDLLKCDSEKVLFELLWPPLPSIISPISNSEDACNILSVIFVSATNSQYSEPIIALILNQISQKLSNQSTASKAANQFEAWTNWGIMSQELARLSVQIFNSSLDCESDRGQLRECLLASSVKFVRDLSSNI
ncbi:huntingtin-like [Convolutriloba macropyga]|uniref:huntingtin-like n=1 Tax=Convolutriloba macropyga TaxID=536237 RepID=UPI003F521644